MRKKNKGTSTRKMFIQLFTVFGLFYYGLSHDMGIFYWIFWGILNIAVAIWRMMEPGYDFKEDVKTARKIHTTLNKKCPYCFSKLPSHFTSKCPQCTADL
jgi:hypothetical protein